VLKQCGTCKHAASFDYGPSPSGPEDGVNCKSEAMAKHLGKYQLEEIAEFGQMNLFRTEVLGTNEDPCECPCWEAKE